MDQCQLKVFFKKTKYLICCGWSGPKRKTGVVLKCPVMIVSVTVVTNMCDHDQFMTNTRSQQTSSDQSTTSGTYEFNIHTLIHFTPEYAIL